MSELELKPSAGQVWTALTDVLIVSGMAACLAFAIVQIGQQIVPAWNAAYIPLYSFVVALEAALSTRLLQHARPPVPWFATRFVEAGVLFLATRSLLGLIRGPDVAAGGAARSGADNELIGLVVIVAIVWLLSWQLTRCLLDLESDDVPTEREAMRGMSDIWAMAQQLLISTLLVVGVVIVATTALLRLSLRNAGLETVAADLPIGHVPLYFALGLILVSKARLAILRTGWRWDGIPIGRRLPTHWLGYSLILLIVITLIASILPTHYPLDLWGTLTYLVQLMIALVQLLWYLILTVFISLLSLLMPQLQRPIAPPQPPALPQFGPAPNANAGATLTISEFAQSLIFWLVFLIVVIYLIRQYADRHPELVTLLRRLPGWSLIARLWHSLSELFGGVKGRIVTVLEERRRSRSAAALRTRSPSQRWINLRRLAPREQVQFYYQALLRRSDERGLARRPSQTPYEYARDLQRHLPEVEPDVTAITDEFIEARYSRHAITPEHVSLVRRCWTSIKRALKRGRMRDEG